MNLLHMYKAPSTALGVAYLSANKPLNSNIWPSKHIHLILKGEACSFLHRVSKTTLALRHGSISHIHTNLDSDQLSSELIQLDWHENKCGWLPLFQLYNMFYVKTYSWPMADPGNF